MGRQYLIPKKKEEIIAALQGHRLPPTHRLRLQQGVEHVALWVQQMEELDRPIEQKIQFEGGKRPYTSLQSIPGLKETAASEILAEVGPQAAAFPRAAPLSWWGGVCPGNDESAASDAGDARRRGTLIFGRS